MSKKNPGVEKRTLHYYFLALKKYKWLSLGSFVANPVATLLRNTVVPITFAAILDRVSLGGVTEEVIFSELLPLGIICILAQAVAAAASDLCLYWLWKMELKAMYDLNDLCFNTIHEQSMQFHNDRFSGSLVSMVGKFTSGFERLWDLIIWTILPLVVTILSTIVVLLFKAPLVALLMTLIIIIFTIVAYFAFKRTAEISKREATAHTKMIGQLSDSISNIMSVKSYAKEKYEQKRFSSFQKKYFNISLEHMRVTISRDVWFDSVTVLNLAFMVFFLITGTTWFGLSVGTLTLIVTYLNNIINQLWRSHSIFKEINRIFGDANDMTLALDEPDEVVDLSSKTLSVSEASVEFSHVSFKHHDAKKAIFEDFNLLISPGERVGLVGVSGSGKTTLTKLLLRFADVEAGEIRVSGTDIRDVTQSSLRENIAYVPQETALFHRSIAENIAYGKSEASLSEIVRAAKLANADEFIQGLPNGYDTLVGERGIKLSGGQRQRIAIARAILKDAPILVLDEATSALDSESEALIQDALSKLMKGRTSIVVAHRLSTVASLDRIVVLKDGKIIEEGSHAELLACGGEYQKLWSRQSGAFLEKEEA